MPGADAHGPGRHQATGFRASMAGATTTCSKPFAMEELLQDQGAAIGRQPKLPPSLLPPRWFFTFLDPLKACLSRRGGRLGTTTIALSCQGTPADGLLHASHSREIIPDHRICAPALVRSMRIPNSAMCRCPRAALLPRRNDRQSTAALSDHTVPSKGYRLRSGALAEGSAPCSSLVPIHASRLRLAACPTWW